jgi:hypothetical protein
LKSLETNKDWIFTTQKFQISKLKEQEVVWANLVAIVANIVAMFEKNKSRIGQLEFELVMLEEMLKKM